jgi:hypothetical protein
MRDDNRAIDLERRKLTLVTALCILSGSTVTITGCGGGSDSPTGPSGDGVSGTVSANHGHSAFVTNVQLASGNAVSLNIAGSAGHSHLVQLTAAQLASINGGLLVSVDSTHGDGHTHSVTFRR